MPEQPKLTLADWALRAEIDQHITIQEEDSVRADWWRASCYLHEWYSTGSKDTVEQAAAEHVERDHPPCAVPSPRTFIGVPLYCRMQPDHGGDEHMNGGYTWPRHPEPPAAAEPTMPTGERYPCLIGTCSWQLEVPPAPVIPPAALAGLFGYGMIARHAANDHQKRIERDFEAHLNTHTVLEFATEISQQRSLNIGLIAQMGELTEAYRGLPARAARGCLGIYNCVKNLTAGTATGEG